MCVVMGVVVVWYGNVCYNNMYLSNMLLITSRKNLVLDWTWLSLCSTLLKRSAIENS